MCSGYWERCKCKDCEEVKGLYENLEWLEDDKEVNSKEIKELKDKIEGMGYFV